MKRTGAILLVCGMLLGCSKPKSAEPTLDQQQAAHAIDVVKKALRDPYSAHFSDVRAKWGLITCGAVNAKNAFGAYIGDRRFYVMSDSAMFEPDPTASDFAEFNSIYQMCPPIH